MKSNFLIMVSESVISGKSPPFLKSFNKFSVQKVFVMLPVIIPGHNIYFHFYSQIVIFFKNQAIRLNNFEIKHRGGESFITTRSRLLV